MQGLKIAGALNARWRSRIERHFEMNLVPYSADFRAFRISLDRTDPSGYVCDLQAERWRGDPLTVSVVHDDGESAIAFACARARREIQRAGRLGRRE